MDNALMGGGDGGGEQWTEAPEAPEVSDGDADSVVIQSFNEPKDYYARNVTRSFMMCRAEK